MIEPFLDTAWLLGTRTAELHLALASDPANPDFAPQPFTAMRPALAVPVAAQPGPPDVPGRRTGGDPDAAGGPGRLPREMLTAEALVEERCRALLPND